jgi:hypothetical protein
LPQGQLDQQRSGDGVGKVAAEDLPGWLGRKDLQRVSLNQFETGLVFKILF